MVVPELKRVTLTVVKYNKKLKRARVSVIKSQALHCVQLDSVSDSANRECLIVCANSQVATSGSIGDCQKIVCSNPNSSADIFTVQINSFNNLTDAVDQYIFVPNCRQPVNAENECDCIAVVFVIFGLIDRSLGQTKKGVFHADNVNF